MYYASLDSLHRVETCTYIAVPATEAAEFRYLSLVIGVCVGVVLLLVLIVIVVLLVAWKCGKLRCCRRRNLSRSLGGDSTKHTTVVNVGDTSLSPIYSEISRTTDTTPAPSSPASTTNEDPDYLHLPPSDKPIVDDTQVFF